MNFTVRQLLSRTNFPDKLIAGVGIRIARSYLTTHEEEPEKVQEGVFMVNSYPGDFKERALKIANRYLLKKRGKELKRKKRSRKIVRKQ